MSDKRAKSDLAHFGHRASRSSDSGSSPLAIREIAPNTASIRRISSSAIGHSRYVSTRTSTASGASSRKEAHLRALALEIPARAKVGRERDRALVGPRSVLRASNFGEQVRARRPCGLKPLHGFIPDRVERLEPGRSAVDASDRRGVCYARAERGRHREERGMEREQRTPVRYAGCRACDVYGL